MLKLWKSLFIHCTHDARRHRPHGHASQEAGDCAGAGGSGEGGAGDAAEGGEAIGAKLKMHR